MQPSSQRLVTEDTLAAQLAALASAPPDVRFVANSSTSSGGTGTVTTLTSSTFVVVPLGTGGTGAITTNQGGGTWDAVNYTLTLPSTGLYLCVAKVRITDSSAARNTHLNIHTSTADDPSGVWRQVGGTGTASRDVMTSTRLDVFNANQLLRLVLYSDGATFPLASSQLSITLLRTL